jgi:Flp pilus assembly protein TadG
MIRRQRQGANAIEFVLLLPVFVLLLAIIFEWGWYFFLRIQVINSVRSGCRQGAVVPATDDPAPDQVANSAIQGMLSGSSMMGADCNDPSDDRCTISTSTSGSSPTEMVVCEVVVEYPGLTGMVPVPSELRASSIAHIELQR